MMLQRRWLKPPLVMLAVALTVAAYSQETSTEGAPPKTSEEPVEAESPERAVFTDELLVTAQRREENAQEVSVAMTVLGGDDLDQLRSDDVTSIGAHVPNVTIKESYGNANPRITIRGVGMSDFNTNTSSPSAIYFDEVYLVSPIMAGFQMFDTRRLELLKGPQGTLYGRNTTGGAVNFIPNRPTHEFGGYFTLGYGTWNTAEAELVVNGGMSGKIAGRLSVRGVQSDGGPWYDRVTGTHFGAPATLAARGQLQWDPTEQVSVLFTAHYGRDTSDGAGYQHIGTFEPGTSDPCEGWIERGPLTYRCVDIGGYRDPDEGDPSQGDYSIFPRNDFESLGGMVKLDWDLGSANLTSITGYVGFDRRQWEDGDASPLAGLDVSYSNEITQFSEEFRLASATEGRVNWLAGLFYGTDEIIGNPNQLFEIDDWLLTRLDSAWDQQTTAAAVFGHIDWSISSEIVLWSGLRFTNEDTRFKAASVDLNPWGTSCLLDPDCDPGFTGPVVFASTDDSIDNNDVSGGIGIKWFMSDEWMLYGGFRKGFKSGGFNGNFVFSDEEYAPFEPETLYSYDVGFKSTLAGGGVLLNAAAFLYDYRDMQVFAVQNVGNFPTLVLTNASNAKIAGFEADVWWQPTASLDLRLSSGYLNTEYVDFETLGEDYSGNKLSNAPELSCSMSLAYQENVLNNTTAGFSVDYSWNDTTYREVSNHPWLTTDSFGLIGARAFVAYKQFLFAVWGRNITDETYTVEGFDNSFFGNLFTIYGFPRTYGATLTVRF
jgi:iron complex outermembrane receptor protein